MDKVKISDKVSAGEVRDRNGQRNLQLLIQDIIDFEKDTVSSALKVDTSYIGTSDTPVHSVSLNLSPKTVAALKDYFIAFLAGERSIELDSNDDEV